MPSKLITMKRFSLLLAASAIMIAACNNNKPKETITIPSEDGKGAVTIDVNQMKNVAEDMEKMKDELGKLTPLSLDELKALIPETLMGAKRKDFNVSSSAGASMASGEYELNDSTEVKLSIYDCAGPGGAGIYSMQYMGLMNFQQESEEEYTKSIEINGVKGFEHCDKISNDCTVTFFSGGRFLVNLEADHVGAPALRAAAAQLKFK